ncbi:MAG: hypothetical protein FWD57_17020, partial [Polyangiaceae bacterium]|nr:hypothetical protein [Polyangiaceae bacterium]
NLDRRVDIYSLGIMLFEMLAGRVPFDGPTAYTTMNMHVREPIPSITLIRPDVPDYVREVIERACAKSRDLRFGSAADMAVALRPGSVVVSAGPDQLPVAPVFPGGATVAQSPFASIASESAGIVPEPQRALSPTEIAMVGGLPAAGVRKTPPSVDPPSQEQGSAKGATEIAVDVDSAVVRVPAMAPKTPTPLLDPPPQDQVSAKGSTVIASKDELAAARGEASPRKKLHVPAHDSSKPPVVRPKPAPAPKAAVTIDAAGGAKSARHLPQKTESGDDGGNPIVSSILEMLLANRALLIPIIAAIVLVPLGIYKAGQPWCSSSETKCGDVCCDNSTELCGFETCHRRCLISGSVYPVGFENPANNCQVCSDSTLNWESRPEGTECGNGKYCNAQSSCIDGCVIDGKVYPRAISCGDGEACHAAAYCDNACVIDGKAYPRGTPNPSNPCQLCLSANPKGWTSAPKGSPCRGSHGVNYQETACDGSGRCGSATISVSVGNNFTCGVTSAGAAKCWGVNDHGQLGNGSTKDSQTPVQVSGLESGVSALVAMRHHACAITGLGNAWCWGSNKDRQIADSDESHLVPIKTFSGVRAIGGSNVNTCAITNSGSVVCRGPGYGISEKAFDQHSDVIALTHGPHERICALSSTGTVLCWDKYGVPTEKSGLSNITSVTAGGSHTCALESSGSVRCWGWNKFGQLGSGTNSDSVYPGYVSDLHSVKAIAAGYNSTCALVSSGSVKCWGHGEYGNLGPGHTVDKNVPVGVSAIGSGSWAIAGLQSHSCVITDKNVVKCWGWQYGYGGSGRNGRGYPHKVWTVAGFP